eukprot:1019-Heterococcus_DN1.PRE.1
MNNRATLLFAHCPTCLVVVLACYYCYTNIVYCSLYQELLAQHTKLRTTGKSCTQHQQRSKLQHGLNVRLLRCALVAVLLVVSSRACMRATATGPGTRSSLSNCSVYMHEPPALTTITTIASYYCCFVSATAAAAA